MLAKNRAAAILSRAGTMVWFRTMVMVRLYRGITTPTLARNVRPRLAAFLVIVFFVFSLRCRWQAASGGRSPRRKIPFLGETGKYRAAGRFPSGDGPRW